MHAQHLREAIVDTLLFCDLPTDKKVVDLLINTACVESCAGYYLKQLVGPACGIFQMEPATAHDIIDNFLKYKPKYMALYEKLYTKGFSLESNLKYNLPFAIFMCRMHYMRVKEAIPETMEQQAEYWKKYYNTPLGKGTVEEFIKKGKAYGNL